MRLSELSAVGSLASTDLLEVTDTSDTTDSPEGTTKKATVDQFATYLRAPVTQAAWYVDPVSGLDTNDGTTSGTALLTLAELNRRWGQGCSFPGASVGGSLLATVVYVMGNVPDTDPLRVNAFLPKTSMLVIEGVVTAGSTGTINAVTALDRTTNQAWQITPDIALTVGDRIRINAGANLDQIFWVAKDLGGGVYRISQPSSIGTIATAASGVPTSGSVSVNDTFVIETLPQMAIAELNVNAMNSTIPRPCISFRNVQLQGAVSSLAFMLTGNALWVFKGCYFNNTSAGVGAGSAVQFFANCQFENIVGGNALTVMVCARYACVLGGLVRGSMIVGPGGSLCLGGDLLVQGPGAGTSALVSCEGGHLLVGTVGVYDSGGAGIRIGGQQFFSLAAGAPNASCWVYPGASSSSVFYGSGNTGVALAITSGSNGAWGATGKTTAMYATGTAGHFSLGGAVVARAWNDATGAYTEAGGAATISCTWDNLITNSIGAGGFGGSAHNIEKSAHFVKLTDL